jgi:hypothetical protein
MSFYVFITDPADGSRNKKGATYSTTVAQQIPPDSGGSVATLQFSSHPDGPWTTCEGIGQGGPVEANPAPWSGQDETYTLPECRQNAASCVRLAVFSDQGLTGPIPHVSAPVYYPAPLVEVPAGDRGPVAESAEIDLRFQPRASEESEEGE